MAKKKKDELLKKWEEWIEEIMKQLSWLLTGQDFFWGMRNIVEANEKIQLPTALHNWIVDNYVAKVTTGIARLNDHDTRTISLHRLIKEISENPDVITREDYVSGYSDDFLIQSGAADRDFDNFAEKTEQHISSSKLKEDIEILDKKTKIIKDFRDQWVAHFDQNRKIDQLPTFGDVAETLEIIDKIFCKYYMLLTRGGMNTCKPTLQYDWKEPLTHAWIE